MPSPDTAAPPTRKWAVQPVETSAKSSREQSPSTEDKPKPRRFAPEPVETTSKSTRGSRQGSPEKDDKPKVRRFAVEPVETSTKSSRQNDAEQESKPKPRRFAVEPVETTQKSSRDNTETPNPPHIKFSPEPVETIHRTNRRPNDHEQVEKKPPRKFAPELLDTAKRSRRRGDSNPAITQNDKTEHGHHIHAHEHSKHIRGERTHTKDSDDMDIDPKDASPVGSYRNLDIPPEMRREISPLDGSCPRRLSMASQRSHSFRCPELDTIESSESERASNISSLSSSPAQGSPITASDSSYNELHKHATRIRESVDESFAHYLLQLEAKKAEQRMREQALAAFPNSDYHEPVQHYVNNDDDSEENEIEDRPVTWEGHDDDVFMEMAARRESTTKVGWEQLEMQRHAERMQEERNAVKTTAKQQSASPWWNAPTYGFGQTDSELRSMQDRARPPMLGMDLVFPRCPSPEPARFDVTQGSTVLRNQMCYLTEHAGGGDDGIDGEVGLWHQPNNDDKVLTWVKSPGASKEGTINKGLWGGFCVDDGNTETTGGGLAPPSLRTGLMTPAVEHATNPFEQSFKRPGVGVDLANDIIIQTPPTPPRSVQNADLGRIDGILDEERQLDKTMETEYPDSFITQVFNYLSLGYPSLARPFDDELAKISRMSMAELRSDDKKAAAAPRGYIRLGMDFEGGGGDGMVEDNCMRWQALKKYIREWARQEKSMVSIESPGNWGAGVRRGSWAI